MPTTIMVKAEVDTEASIAAGYDPTQTTIAVDLEALSEEERSLLSRHVAKGRDGQLNTGPSSVKVGTPTAASLVAALLHFEAVEVKRAKEAAERDAEAAAMAERLVHVLEGATVDQLAKALEDAYDQRRALEDLARKIGSGVDLQEAKLPAELPEALAANMQTAKDLNAERKRAADEAAAAAKAARIDAVRAWATEHGSERVQLLLEEDHKAWLAVAEDEFLEAHIPQGWEPYPYSVRDRTKPTIEDVQALRAARELTQEDSSLTHPRMAWVVIYRAATEDEIDEGDADEDGDVVDEKYSAIFLDVITPTGKELAVHRPV